MNSLVLAYPESDHKIKTVTRGNEVLFCLADVVSILNKQNIQFAGAGRPSGLGGLVTAMIDVLDKDEKLEIESLGELHERFYITQPGLFRIILRDKSEACKRFQRWVIHEVLPSIQKHGTYPAPLNDGRSELLKIAQTLVSEIEAREKLERETKENFALHDRRLNELTEKVEIINKSTAKAVYIEKMFSIDDFLAEIGCKEVDYQLMEAWCMKICLEDESNFNRNLFEGQSVKIYPINVLQKALKEVKG